MIRRPITIINKLGLHARATAKLVNTASRFDSSVRISGKGRDVDAKNIMQVMMLAASKGSEICISCEGDQAEQAMTDLVGLVNDYFGEGE